MFRDRKDAGAKLTSRLLKYKDNDDTLVLALPRGGVVTGYEVARALGVPLDVLIVRKIGVPWQPELAAAALSKQAASSLTNLSYRATGYQRNFWKKRF